MLRNKRTNFSYVGNYFNIKMYDILKCFGVSERLYGYIGMKITAKKCHGFIKFVRSGETANKNRVAGRSLPTLNDCKLT